MSSEKKKKAIFLTPDENDRLERRMKALGIPFASSYINELIMWDNKHRLIELCRNAGASEAVDI